MIGSSGSSAASLGRFANPRLQLCIDPHHHFWDTPQRGHYLLPELLADIGGGHNIIATVFLERRSMYRKDSPAEMAPVGEVEFVKASRR